MTSLLRQLVAGPRSQHVETGLDLCYVTPNIIATSGPSQTYPQRAYRNPLDRLVGFLDSSHGDGWAIWEFRAEGTGYPDEAVHNRIRHYPFPDHHPPPFRLVPMIMASMRDWLKGAPLDGTKGSTSSTGSGNDAATTDKPSAEKQDGDGEKKSERVVVVHCKAGKGRSGTMACSYLISECGWTPEDALNRFTERRMRPRFGAGVSIPSQLRWIDYVDRWTRGGKRFVDRPVEVVEVHVWGLRHGVKVSVEGFVDEGKRIKDFHTFSRDERIVVEGSPPGGGGIVDLVSDMAGYGGTSTPPPASDGEEKPPEGGTKVEGVASGDEAEEDDKNNGTPSKIIAAGRATASLIQMAKFKENHDSSASSSSASLNKLNHKIKSKTIAITPATATPPNSKVDTPLSAGAADSQSLSQSSLPLKSAYTYASDSEPGGQAVIMRPAAPIRLEGGDVRIALERRNRATPRLGSGWAVVTSVAHAWFNAFFEGGGAENDGHPADEGVFEIEWDAMDGLKGSSKKGSRACDRVAVVWRVVSDKEEGAAGVGAGVVLEEPAEGAPVPQMRPADWKGVKDVDPEAGRHLGLQVEEPDSEAVSKASSIKSQHSDEGDGQGNADTDTQEDDDIKGVKASGPSGEEVVGESTKDSSPRKSEGESSK